MQVADRFFTPNVIGRNGMSVNDCIAELVANSFDWCISKKNNDNTKITISVNSDSIEILDNGVGMNLSELESAINIAESSDEIRNKIDEFAERKGMYGMGMKVSTLSLGWKFTITTIPFDNPETEFVFVFDSRRLVNDENYTRENLIITEDFKSEDSPLKYFRSGTHIKIEDLVKRLPSINNISDEMRLRFSPDINNLLDLNKLEFVISDRFGGRVEIGKYDISYDFQDEVLKTDFSNPNEWCKKREYYYTGSDGKKYQLKGYLQLLRSRSYQGEYGLNLYCKGQLIERFHKSKKDGLFSIEGRTGEKTYGELHLDGLIPDYVKSKGFINDDSFKEVASLIADDLKFYSWLSIATRESSKRISDEINKRKGIGKYEEESDPGEESSETEEIEGHTESEGLDSENGDEPNGDTDSRRNLIQISKNLKIEINDPLVIEHGLDKSLKLSRESYYEASKSDKNLYLIQIYLNPESSLYKAFDDLYEKQADKAKAISLLKKITICESIFDKLISNHNYSEEQARQITDLKVYPKVLKLKID